MEPEPAVHIDEHLPPATRGTLVRCDTVLGKSDSAAIVLRSLVGYDEGIKIETEFLLRMPGTKRRPLRGALDPQKADPAISFGSGTQGDFQSLTWNYEGKSLSVWMLGADETHSRLTIKTWTTPVPDELVIGVRWLSQDIPATHLRVDCRHAEPWSAQLWPDRMNSA